MGILSSTVSITRYRVEGKIEEPVLETIATGLAKNAITEIDDEASEKSVGWTSLESPFRPDFSGSSFVIGPYLVFSLRIDKKSIPAKIVKKHYQIEMAKRLTETGREHLAKSEKQEIKERVVELLSMRIPATPSVCDVLWNVEEAYLWFYSTQKAANEELETLFAKSFKSNLIRLFPYTIAHLAAGLSDAEQDALAVLSPARFAE
ncbi:recombination-associated protein RdgC [Desulfococcus sp.]|uniref:recombination-associated protein RdgC n=1 Tax=Desulfococcus sp. TaxID=2025834 RepID=UPI003592ECC2